MILLESTHALAPWKSRRLFDSRSKFKCHPMCCSDDCTQKCYNIYSARCIQVQEVLKRRNVWGRNLCVHHQGNYIWDTAQQTSIGERGISFDTIYTVYRNGRQHLWQQHQEICTEKERCVTVETDTQFWVRMVTYRCVFIHASPHGMVYPLYNHGST